MPQPSLSQNNNYPFLQGGGEMGNLIRSIDWSANPLGLPESWPSSLKQTVSMMLKNTFPVLICWGPDFIQLYNDAFRPINGASKHPQAMGGSARDTYAEIWETIGPMFGEVMQGKTHGFPNFMVPLDRNGYPEDCYFDFSYSPVADLEGEIHGVLVICVETTEKVKSIKELAESEERFRTMAESTDILIAVGDETGDAVYFNKAWADATGRSVDDLVKFGWADLMHPDDKEQVISAFIDAFKLKQPFAWEFRMPNKKGGYNWLYAKGVPRFRSDGSFAGYISSSFDITERKQWEISLENASEELQSINEEMASSNEELASTNEELAATNEELVAIQQLLRDQTIEKQNAIDQLNANEQNIRNMVRQAPVGMCIVEGDPLYVVEINDSFLEIIGKTREEMKNKPYWEAIPEAADYYRPITDNVLATGKTYHANEHQIALAHNGKEDIVHVDFVYEPMIDFEGRPYAIMIVAIDITDKVLARRNVERAEEGLRMAVEAAGLGTYYINATDRIFYASPRLKEFFGFRPDEEVPYEAAINQIHPDYRQRAADLVEAAFTKGVRFDMEYPVVGYHDGSIRWVRGIGTMQHYDGKDFFTGVLHDITESKKDEIRKNDFIGMVSHELKTPLTSLNAIIQVANAKLKDNNDSFLANAMTKANTQVKRMSQMINGFLNISRLESGKILIEKKRFDIRGLVEEIAEEMKLIVATHTITVATCDAIEVYADRDKINSVISNLVSNAVKYSPKGTNIEISCKIAGNEVILSVKDQGMGIKPEDAAKIFDRYYRVESSHTQHISGFGIGLYLSAEIIQRHDGRIGLESEQGKGSTFYFSLPLK